MVETGNRLLPFLLVWISLFLQIKTKIVSSQTAYFKPVKEEVNGAVILPPLVFPGYINPRLSKEVL